MNEFDEKLKSISIEALKEFLENMKKPCYESELLRIAFQDKNIIKSDALSLYQNHFILFFTLYKLQEDYFKNGKYLHVHFMRTFLVDYPEKGKCSFYNEDISCFCNQEVSGDSKFCDFHLEKNGINEIDSISTKYFYFDITNYSRLDSESAETFINGTWELLSKYNDVKESFRILDIPESYDIELIKKQFKILAKKYHPDLGEVSHQKFNEINRAYRFLMKIIPVLDKNKIKSE